MRSERRTDGTRVVTLTGSQPWHEHTVATLLDSGANVVGICIADDTTAGIPLQYLRRNIKRRGIRIVADQVAGRAVYKLLNARTDRQNLHRVFRILHAQKVIWTSGVPIHRTRNFGNAQTVDWLQSLRPDLLVVHTSQWVPRVVRELPASGLVIGGHPGLTPYYRGAHSAFWALYNGRPQDVGFSVFHLDAGIDTGDLIRQERIEVTEGDTYFSLGWRAMREIAKTQAELIADIDAGRNVPRTPHPHIPEQSEYPIPGLVDYIRYRRRQKLAR